MSRARGATADTEVDSYRGTPSAGDAEDDNGSAFSSEYDGMDASMVDMKPPRGCVPRFSATCCCHFCYVVLFLIYMVIFPVWCKWLITAPMPFTYWYEEFPLFPNMLKTNNGTQQALKASPDWPSVIISPIPSSPTSCNYSCSSYKGYRTGDMNFKVSLLLNDSNLAASRAHTTYPVLFASSDFNFWFVVADRRHAHPQPFWDSRTAFLGRVYEYITPTCIRPPDLTKAGGHFADTFAGSYFLACVTWKTDKLKKLEAAEKLATEDLPDYCDHVGGVCGWPCESGIPANRLDGCSAKGVIKVSNTEVAGQSLDNQFTGTITMEQCEEQDPNSDQCTTSTQPLSAWTCHQCKWIPSGASSSTDDTTGGIMRRLQAADSTDASSADSEVDTSNGIIYNSLPRFMVRLQGAGVPEGTDVLSVPRAYVFTTSVADPGNWNKLYPRNKGDGAPPMPVSVTPPPGKTDAEIPVPPVQQEELEHAMSLREHNRLDIDPTWCYPERGPLYLVACVLNSTVYQEVADFQFQAGQRVAPPPFNDRCLAVSGRCGYSCMGSDLQEEDPLPYCNEDGYINITDLVGDIPEQGNDRLAVWLFVYTMLIGFSVKVVMLCPGIFTPYRHCSRYDPYLTEQLRYIIICIPSAGENKHTVLRNMVGAVACMPRDCRCRYHVVFADEGHRAHMKVMWQKFGEVLNAVPFTEPEDYEQNLLSFLQAWVQETNKLDLNKLEDGGSRVIEKSVTERCSGRAALRRMRKEGGWKDWEPQVLEKLEAAITNLEVDLNDKTQSRFSLHLDDVADWEPMNRESLPLRLHYLARAKPNEDERTVKAQHVAPGTWYYKVPLDAKIDDWLELRKHAQEMRYGAADQEDESLDFNVPLRTSRGKAGGLNFCENYITCYAERPENLYGDERDEAPCLYSISDARHQFQPDFFHTTLPYFFTEEEDLDVDVAFTQCPQYFHEMQDKCDYLDNNNAQFFRLNCMVRNCCGGVSSCGTNGTWMIKHRDNSTVWEAEKKRVRDKDRRKKPQVVERRIFHESCKVEDTASSLQQVLLGRRSQFINRRLSYGMAKAPQDYLAAVQRWAEGGVVLCWQTLCSCHKGVYMVWMTLIFFSCFVASLFRLVSVEDARWWIVDMGICSVDTVNSIMIPIRKFVRFLDHYFFPEAFANPQRHMERRVDVHVQCVVWVLGLCFALFLVWVVTRFAHCCKRRCCTFPNEMRWWGRLIISMDNLTYFFWFWTAFFWIGFNFSSVFFRKYYHFQAQGMFGFLLAVQILQWSMIIAQNMRYTMESSMETNEVIMLTMDNIWRSTQLFYICAPLLLYSIIKGTQDYIRYQFYGEDISFWMGGDRGIMSKNLVKYWTLLIILGAIASWIFWAIEGHEVQGSLSACIIVTIISLDVLHPCAYLWVGECKLDAETAKKMTWMQALKSRAWWERRIYALILNQTMTGLLKWVDPLWFVLYPWLSLVSPYVGINSAFSMVGTNTQR